MSNEFSRGIEKFKRDLQRKIEKASQPADLGEMFNPGFMSRYTDYATFEEMFEAGGFGPATVENFKAAPDDAWNAWVAKSTRFPSWEEMQKKAGAELLQKRLK